MYAPEVLRGLVKSVRRGRVALSSVVLKVEGRFAIVWRLFASYNFVKGESLRL